MSISQKGLVSLLTLMHEYSIDDLMEVLGALHSTCKELAIADGVSTTICTDEYLLRLISAMRAARQVCGNFEADPSLISQISNYEQELVNQMADRRDAVVRARLMPILVGIENNIASRKFMYVPRDQAVYWEPMFMCGDAFLISFPKAAKVELHELGKCFAAGRWTACVYHCMRLSEHGLRKLARKLRVTISDKGKMCPLEYGTWDKVITGIRNKILEIRKKPQGPQREQALQFLSRAADRCEYIKDIWRNETSHTRRTYNKAEALGTINRVRDFIKDIAEHDVQTRKRVPVT